ncbi:MAG: phosphoglycolate phosphatase [Candidatus Muproteobacteria bacterium RBG_16_64_10]|uniref:Phosphoglycolate phosphatase n=1 Tax=Candidatus Muproteobacteria bacterium RBG_16_64_10 TaxID=1817757 RepID=A0A1F6SZV6_9PROT|nr:MAG: phosphoglycolate phosphatase [Candidatus Muproteobacteria bacterium RBG_16_64_10]
MSHSFPLAVKMVMIDLDGTLIDTVPDLAAAADRMLADLGRAGWDEAHYRTWIGNGVPRFVKRALTGEMQAEPEAVLFERGLALFRQHYGAAVADLSRPYPGVVAGLDQLASAGFQLACITNKAEAFTLPLLKQLDLHKYFKLVLSGDSLPKQKPDPLPLMHACKHFDITPDHGVLLGDSSNDVQAARAAGMPVICVTYGYNHGHDIRESHPDAVVDSLTDVPPYLRLYA